MSKPPAVHPVRQEPDISVVIINWKSCDYVQACLSSLRRHAALLALEILVVDNASYDGCSSMIESCFPEVTFIQSEDNIGFARANNLGFSRSSGKHILFLNPDTEVETNALQEMFAVLNSDDSIGMVGAKLLNTDGSLQDNCITASPTILNQALSSNLLRKMFPKSRLWGKQVFFNSTDVPAPVEAISGACMLVRREIVEKLQGFKTDYFMYAEDSDLCMRIRRAGWKVYYAPKAEVFHHAGGSSALRKESNFSSIMTRESLSHFFVLYRGTFYRRLFIVSCAVASSLRLTLLGALLVPLSLHAEQRRATLRAMRKWSTILCWSIGMNRWAGYQIPESHSMRLASATILEKLPES